MNRETRRLFPRMFSGVVNAKTGRDQMEVFCMINVGDDVDDR